MLRLKLLNTHLQYQVTECILYMLTNLSYVDKALKNACLVCYGFKNVYNGYNVQNWD